MELIFGMEQPGFSKRRTKIVCTIGQATSSTWENWFVMLKGRNVCDVCCYKTKNE